MFLYLIRRPAMDCGPSEWLGTVVAAESEQEASELVTFPLPGLYKEAKRLCKEITCKKIGDALEETQKGVIFEGYDNWEENYQQL